MLLSEGSSWPHWDPPVHQLFGEAKESLHSPEAGNSPNLAGYVGQAAWKVGAVFLRRRALVSAGPYLGQEDQATEQC